MIKILQVDLHSGIGGGEKIMFSLIKGMRQNINFVILTSGGFYFNKYNKLKTKTYRLPCSIFGKLLTIYKIIKKETPEIVHIHGTRSAFFVRIAVIFLKRKPRIIYTLHGFHIIRKKWPLNKILVFIEKFLNHWTDVLVCVSEADKKLVLKYGTMPAGEIKVIKNGIDKKQFQINDKSSAVKLKSKLGIENKFILLAVGRLHPPKDYLTILKAVALLVDKIPNIKLLIAGDGKMKDCLKKETSNLKIGEYVSFLGYRKDVPLLLKIADIVVLSTNWEGLPLVPLEAGACRKPIIASNIDGVSETIINGETGFLFKKASPKDLAEKILTLYKNKKLRESMGENGYAFVSSNFSEEKMVQEYNDLYKSSIKK